MGRKWLRLLLGLGIVTLLSFNSCRMAVAYDTISNIVSVSYTNVVGYEYEETNSGMVNVFILAGPSMQVTKTTLNLRNGAQGDKNTPIVCVPGDTIQIDLVSHNVGDAEAYWIVFVDTFPAYVGDPDSNSVSYVVGSETCAISGALSADSISWSVDAGHTWNAWQTYDNTVSASIPATCTGIRWRWNIITNDGSDTITSWIRARYNWFRNQR